MKLLTLLSIVVFMVSCASMDKAMTGASSVPTKEERQKKSSEFPNLTPTQKTKFINGEPWIGMEQAQLQAMWDNEPWKTKSKLTSRGNEEIQYYKLRIGDWKSGIRSRFYRVAMLEGKVAELQEMNEREFTEEASN